MSVVFLTGNHPRHRFMAAAVARSGQLSGIIYEQREEHVPQPHPRLRDETAALFVHHFAGRSAAEADTLSGIDNEMLRDIPSIVVSRDELNGVRVYNFLDARKPRLLLSYGVHKLSPATLAHAQRCWNIHGGLSPWYRGVTTHFWPSYLLAPQMTGMTVHETTDAIDGGAIIHQTSAELVRGDGLHVLACRAVASLAREIPELLGLFDSHIVKPAVLQKTSGRIWRGDDWRPEHLHLIYDFYDDRIVDRYLDGDLPIVAPDLVRQF